MENDETIKLIKTLISASMMARGISASKAADELASLLPFGHKNQQLIYAVLIDWS